MIKKFALLLTILLLSCNSHKNQSESKKSDKKAVEESDYYIKNNSLSKKQTEKLISEGQNFLAENKKKEGVVTLTSGLQYKIIKKGEGLPATIKQKINTHYAGTTIDGKEFDSSLKRDMPFEVTSQKDVIKGWQEVLKLMPKGSKWQVFIPHELAYGVVSPSPDIKPYSVLIFEIEILDIYN